jgi:hypothetical protein
MLAIRFRLAQRLGGGRVEGAIHPVVLTEGKRVAPGTFERPSAFGFVGLLAVFAT